VSLPHISNSSSIVKKEDTRPLSDTRKKKRKEGKVDSKETNGNQTAPTNSNVDMELSGTTAAIKSKPQNSKVSVLQMCVCCKGHAVCILLPVYFQAVVADVKTVLKETDTTVDHEVSYSTMLELLHFIF